MELPPEGSNGALRLGSSDKLCTLALRGLGHGRAEQRNGYIHLPLGKVLALLQQHLVIAILLLQMHSDGVLRLGF